MIKLLPLITEAAGHWQTKSNLKELDGSIKGFERLLDETRDNLPEEDQEPSVIRPLKSIQSHVSAIRRELRKLQ